MDRITARMTKDLNGYNDYFAEELDKLIVKRWDELLPLYNRMQKSAVAELEALNREIEKLPAAKRKSRRFTKKMQEQYVAQILPDLELAKAAQDVYATEVLSGAFEYGYYTQAYGLEQAAKVAVNVPILNRSGVLGIIANDWIGDGNTYSDRIRKNTDFVAKQSEKVVKQLVTKRLSYADAAYELSGRIRESYGNARRIIHTEMTRANGLGVSYAAMENADILDGKYRDAVRDGRTSAMCATDADYSYKHPYPLDYDTPANPGVPGKRIPNHPFCRCRWRMVLSSVGVNKRSQIARKNDTKDSYGETYYTEAVTYDAYAKERGLPSVKEMLERGSPKSYLRPGETVESLNKKVKRVKLDSGKTVTVSRASWDKNTTVKDVPLAKPVESVIIKEKQNIMPNAITAATSRNKLQTYLLNSNHPRGKHKARVIKSVLGYHYQNWDILSNKIFDAVQTTGYETVEITKHGTKYVIPVSITSEITKRTMILKTVWQVDKGSNIPRLITITFNK